MIITTVIVILSGIGSASLSVFIVPGRGLPGTVDIVENTEKNTWARAMVTTRNINTVTTLVVRGVGPGVLAVDDVIVSRGKCGTTRN